VKRTTCIIAAGILIVLTIAAHAIDVDYLCGKPWRYSIVIEPKDRIMQTFNTDTQTTSTVAVTKGIKIINETNGKTETVKPAFTG